MDKLDFMILNVLNESEAHTSISAISRKAILGQIETGAQNLFLRLGKLVNKELVGCGLKEGREHTYFITDAGMNKLMEVFK